MNASKPDELLETLHEDVLQSLGRIVALLDNAGALAVNWAGTVTDTARATARMREHAESVRKLELIMPIVAPMKAGKSTLINAIIGYPLLPARANPMTTLPTRIKLVDGLDLDKPELALTDRTIALLNRVGAQLQRRIRETKWQVPEAHSYLADLADLIASGRAEPLRSRYEGAQAIRDVLMRLNDQLRLAALATEESFIADIEDLPEISTGYRAAFSASGPATGQLVIVDTPGPNEQAMSAHLGPTLEQQLAASHVVLVVLDYTQMGAEAADVIRAKLLTQLSIITTSKILAVVNKVDERKKPEDLTQEQTRTAVCAALGLTRDQADRQVFETVARWGLIGAQVLADIDHFGESLIGERSESVAALLKEVAPVHWERRLKHVQVAELKDDAEDLLAQSGLRELVSSAIARLKAGAAPSVIESGIHRYQDALVKLKAVLVLELNSAASDSATLARELADLTKEMKRLQGYQSAMPDVATLERRFRSELRGFIKLVREHGRSMIDLVRDADPQSVAGSEGSFSEALQVMFRNTRKFLWEGVLRGKPADEVHEFGTQAEAEAFMTSITGRVTEELRALLDFARKEVDTRARKLAAEVVAEQEDKVRSLVERATAQLERAFDVTLQVPPPAVVDGELAVELADPQVRSWSTEESYTTTERRRAWYKLWIGYHDVTITNYRTVSHTRYQVSRQDVATQLTDAFDAHLVQIGATLDNYVATEVSGRLAAYYAALRGYLESYHAALTNSQATKKNDETAKAARKRDLTALNSAIGTEQLKLTEYLTRLKDYGHRAGPDGQAASARVSAS